MRMRGKECERSDGNKGMRTTDLCTLFIPFVVSCGRGASVDSKRYR